ncbi:Cytochrome c oxidase subunit 4 [Vermiconidia calcicola]|uniref:Cytochrome c oxidase subunit 4 n=1 Tax=Vermiconidia calcicola TaxID=1690605 RepID=A0ACC3MY76_9PEZI|nr:Cytochrome c oxidase subunit 4 [Vermiconidia calcicola]
MFLRRAAPALARHTIFKPVVKRSFSLTARQLKEDSHADPKPGEASKLVKPFEEITSQHDLLPPGGAPGTIPTDLEQATGLERLEILGKMQGIDIFDMRPLDASRKGTPENPIAVKSFGDEQYVGCTGSPADSHNTIWLTTSRERPMERCPECGSCYLLEYVGPPDDHSHDDHHHDVPDYVHPYEGEPKTIADFVKAEYR